jgi:hypothetical protein
MTSSCKRSPRSDPRSRHTRGALGSLADARPPPLTVALEHHGEHPHWCDTTLQDGHVTSRAGLQGCSNLSCRLRPWTPSPSLLRNPLLGRLSRTHLDGNRVCSWAGDELCRNTHVRRQSVHAVVRRCPSRLVAGLPASERRRRKRVVQGQNDRRCLARTRPRSGLRQSQCDLGPAGVRWALALRSGRVARHCQSEGDSPRSHGPWLADLTQFRGGESKLIRAPLPARRSAAAA